MNNYLEQLDLELKHCDDFLRIGARTEAGLIIDQILDSLKKRPRLFPRSLKPRVAFYLRRLGRSHEAVRILYPLVKLKLLKLQKISDLGQLEIDELEEYSALLINLRAEEQARAILESLLKFHSPKTKLFLGMLFINGWDYERAKGHLQDFVDMKKPERLSYYHFIGVVNLMASKVSLIENEFMNHSELLKELDYYVRLTKELDYLVLHANLLEIKTQALVNLSLFGKETKEIETAKKILKDEKTRDSLYVKKWSLLAQIPPSNGRPEKINSFLDGLKKLKIAAKEINDYETVRDLEYYQAQYEENLMDKIYYGTPSPTFRKRILALENVQISDHYWYETQNDETTKKIKEIDYLKYRDLKPGTLIYKVIFGLCLDFYRPPNIYALFEILFPKEFFNPESSPNKIHKALQRTRQWLKKHHLPLEIHEDQGSYFLKGACAIKIYMRERFHPYPDKHLPLSSVLSFEALKMKLGLREFKAHEAQMILKHPNLRATQRLLKTLIEENLIEALGNTRSTAYRILQ